MPPSALALSGPRYLLSALVSKRHMHRDQAVNSLMQWKECTKNTHVLSASPGTPNLTILLGPDIILISRMTLSAEVLRGLDTPPLRFAIQAGSKMGTALLSAHFYSYSEFRATAASTRAACLYLRGLDGVLFPSKILDGNLEPRIHVVMSRHLGQQARPLTAD
uniref:Uncharacterized protein n=1 Tax=Bionectria ochroleuca TaxID=29856 RepID=A0A0B7KBR7_BIOOC